MEVINVEEYSEKMYGEAYKIKKGEVNYNKSMQETDDIDDIYFFGKSPDVVRKNAFQFEPPDQMENVDFPIPFDRATPSPGSPIGTQKPTFESSYDMQVPHYDQLNSHYPSNVTSTKYGTKSKSISQDLKDFSNKINFKQLKQWKEVSKFSYSANMRDEYHDILPIEFPKVQLEDFIECGKMEPITKISPSIESENACSKYFPDLLRTFDNSECAGQKYKHGFRQSVMCIEKPVPKLKWKSFEPTVSFSSNDLQGERPAESSNTKEPIFPKNNRPFFKPSPTQNKNPNANNNDFKITKTSVWNQQTQFPIHKSVFSDKVSGQRLNKVAFGDHNKGAHEKAQADKDHLLQLDNKHIRGPILENMKSSKVVEDSFQSLRTFMKVRQKLKF